MITCCCTQWLLCLSSKAWWNTSCATPSHDRCSCFSCIYKTTSDRQRSVFTWKVNYSLPSCLLPLQLPPPARSDASPSLGSGQIQSLTPPTPDGTGPVTREVTTETIVLRWILKQWLSVQLHRTSYELSYALAAWACAVSLNQARVKSKNKEQHKGWSVYGLLLKKHGNKLTIKYQRAG